MRDDAWLIQILELYDFDKTRLMDIYWAIHDEHGFVSKRALMILSEKLNMSVVDLEETLSFYHFFKSKPSSKYQIYLADTVIARQNGFDEVLAAFEHETGTSLGAADSTTDFSVNTTACIGLSDQEPAALINFIPFTNLTAQKVSEIISQLNDGKSPQEIANPKNLNSNSAAYIDQLISTKIRKSGPVFFNRLNYRDILDKILEPDSQIIETIKTSDLRGRGGAGFPTGLKWQFCKETKAEKHYIVCNADEGEPGTFKDRALLSHSPRQVFLGMTIAAHAVGAKEGIIYLRAEYRYMCDYLEAKLAELRQEKLLGLGILNTDFDFNIRIQLGAGAYVCGEETALLESLEGKRGTPRLKPPFPVSAGYLNQPTVINNVETFAAVTKIMEHGADWYKQLGTTGSSGSKLLSISGDCQNAGIYELEWGTSLEQALAMADAKDAYAAQVSGPSGEMVAVKTEKTRQICFEDLNCGGSFMIFNKERDLLEVVKHFIEFFVEESCGICVPCRAGNVQLLEKFKLILAKRASNKDLEDMRNWAEIISQSSRCGLGISSPNPIVNTLDKFPELYQNKLRKSKTVLLPSFNLEESTREFDKIVKEQA